MSRMDCLIAGLSSFLCFLKKRKGTPSGPAADFGRDLIILLRRLEEKSRPLAEGNGGGKDNNTRSRASCEYGLGSAKIGLQWDDKRASAWREDLTTKFEDGSKTIVETEFLL